MPLGRARCGATIPSDLLAAKCIPPGFMVQKGWEIVSDYYQRQKTVRHAGLQPRTSSPPSRQGGAKADQAGLGLLLIGLLLTRLSLCLRRVTGCPTPRSSVA